MITLTMIKTTRMIMRLFTMIMMLLTWTLSKRDNDNVDKNDDVD